MDEWRGHRVGRCMSQLLLLWFSIYTCLWWYCIVLILISRTMDIRISECEESCSDSHRAFVQPQKQFLSKFSFSHLILQLSKFYLSKSHALNFTVSCMGKTMFCPQGSQPCLSCHTWWATNGRLQLCRWPQMKRLCPLFLPLVPCVQCSTRWSVSVVQDLARLLPSLLAAQCVCVCVRRCAGCLLCYIYCLHFNKKSVQFTIIL